MSGVVTTEQAIVYRAGGRRFFTKRSAIRAAAMELLREEMGDCECEGGGGDEPGYVCPYHEVAYGIADDSRQRIEEKTKLVTLDASIAALSGDAGGEEMRT